MTILKKKKKIILIALAISLLAPGMTALFTKEYHLILLNTFSLMSLCLLALFCGYLVTTFCRSEDRKFLLGSWLLLSLIGFVIYCSFLFNRIMVYESDHTVYYDLQFELWDLFRQSQIKGFAGIILSCFHSDYSYFMCIPLSFVFSLSSRSHEAHILTYYLLFIVPFYLTAVLLSYSFAQRYLKLYARTGAVVFGLCILFFPMLHFAALLGMPDIFGLFFCFSILILVINQNLGVYSRYFSLCVGILSVLLVYTRRWYMFWLIGFFPSLFFAAFIEVWKRREGWLLFLRNEIKNAGIIFLTVAVLMLPFLYHNVFVRRYSTEYAAYNLGGFSFELFNQVGYLGILLTLLLLIGLMVGMLSEKQRMLSVTVCFGFLISIWAFTRIQNMGKHQSLVLFPYYSILLMNYIRFALVSRGGKKTALLSILAIVFILNALSTVLIWHDDLEGVFLLTKYAIASRFVWL